MRRALLTIAVVTIAALGLCAGVLRVRQLRWGASRGEAAAPLPGDDLIPDPDLTSTRAISIAAPIERIWAWLAQLRQGRGGLHSYDRLENLAGCQIHSAERVEPVSLLSLVMTQRMLRGIRERAEATT